MYPTTRGTTEAAVRKRFGLSGVVAFALIGVAFALEAFGPISLSQQAPQATQKIISVRVEQAGWTSPKCPQELLGFVLTAATGAIEKAGGLC
jgi:hypothetical protein